jgi:hypothetical protein
MASERWSELKDLVGQNVGAIVDSLKELVHGGEQAPNTIMLTMGPSVDAVGINETDYKLLGVYIPPGRWKLDEIKAVVQVRVAAVTCTFSLGGVPITGAIDVAITSTGFFTIVLTPAEGQTFGAFDGDQLLEMSVTTDGTGNADRAYFTVTLKPQLAE